MSHSNAYELTHRRMAYFTWYSGNLVAEVKIEGPNGVDSSLFLSDASRSAPGVSEIRVFLHPDQLRQLRDEIDAKLQKECPSCHPSGGARYRSGEDIRQKEDGSLTCLACGRVVAPAESTDVP